MKFSYKSYEYLAYALIFIIFFFVVIYSSNYQRQIIQNLSFREKINKNSNIEGFGNNNYKKKYNNYNKDEDIFKLIENKLKGLTEELGGSSGKKEVKQILTNTKKICNMECAKCMMNMIEENKGIKSVDFDKMLEDEDSDNCIKCRKYTELSDSIKSMIDNL